MARRPRMIYSKKDISKFYTNLVKEYLENGYDINIESMNGSQGEDSRIDMVKDGEVIRIILDQKYEMYIGTIDYIRIIRFEYDGSRIYWNERGQFLKTFNFLPAKDNKNFYMVEYDDLGQIVQKIIERDNDPFDDWNDLSSKYYPIFKKVVQKFNQPGWKKFNITRVTTKVYNDIKCYRVFKSNGDNIDLWVDNYKFYLD